MTVPAADRLVRVALFTDNDFEKVNGVTTTLRGLLQRLPHDVRVRVYTADRQGSDEMRYFSRRAVPVGIPFYPGMSIYPVAPWSYAAQVQEDGVDVVHITTPGPVGVAGLYTARRLRRPLVGSFHTDLAQYATLLSGSRSLGRVMGSYLRLVYGGCQRVLVPSAATSGMLADGGLRADRHVIWPRGVDTGLFNPARRSASLRQRWGVDDDTPVVIYAGRLSAEKNLAAFGALADRLGAAGTAHRLVFVGDGPLRREIESRFPDAVVTGAVPHASMPDYLASADVFAFPSRTDTAGNVVLEAQACGLPAVVCDEGGPRFNVDEGSSAFVVDGRRPEGFVRAVRRLIDDAGLRAVMGLAARDYAVGRDWPAALAPLFATYRSVASPATCTVSGLTAASSADRA